MPNRRPCFYTFHFFYLFINDTQNLDLPLNAELHIGVSLQLWVISWCLLFLCKKEQKLFAFENLFHSSMKSLCLSVTPTEIVNVGTNIHLPANVSLQILRNYI